MNRYLTLCAKAKLNSLIKSNNISAIRFTSKPSGSFGIDFVFTSNTNSDIILSSAPRVVTNMHTLQQLSDSSIDFSYTDGDFIIKREKNVNHANIR